MSMVAVYDLYRIWGDDERMSDFDEFAGYYCDGCKQMPCDGDVEKCPFALAAYLIQTRDDDLCDHISQYLRANK